MVMDQGISSGGSSPIHPVVRSVESEVVMGVSGGI